jgi:hypothetical protein
LSHRAHLKVGNIEEVGESIFKRNLARPLVHPEHSPPPIANRIFGSELEEMFNLVKAAPKLGAPLSRSLKDVVGGGVFRSDDLGPYRVIWLEKLPNPLKQQGPVHLFGVKEPQPTTLLRPTNCRPVNKMITTLGARSFPVESSPMRVELSMNTVVQEE